MRGERAEGTEGREEGGKMGGGEGRGERKEGEGREERGEGSETGKTRGIERKESLSYVIFSISSQTLDHPPLAAILVSYHIMSYHVISRSYAC